MLTPVPPPKPLRAWSCTFDGATTLQVAPTSAKAKADFVRHLSDFYSGNLWPLVRVKVAPQDEAAERAIEEFEDAGKYWRDTRKYARLQAQVDAFNARYPVGHPVQVIDCCEARTWPGGRTKVRTPAWVSGPNDALVSVEGYPGGFALKYIHPLPTEALPG